MFEYYLARNKLLLEGNICKICLKKLQIVSSHIYSGGVLRITCGRNNKVILLGYCRKPKFITPHLCRWKLPECGGCDNSTSDIENDFKQRLEDGYYHSSMPILPASDKVLFYIYIERGLAENVDLMHYGSCSNCKEYFLGIKKVLEQAWNFRRTILQNCNSPKEKKIKDMEEMAHAANKNLLFHSIGVSEYLIEFPLLCVVRTESGSCPLVYAQIPPCCWAVPLDPSSPALPEVAKNFSAVVRRINEVLLRSIPVEEGKTAKLIIGYLPKCCIEIDMYSYS